MKKIEVTPNDQITLPKEVVHILGVKPGDRLVFKFKDGDIILQKEGARHSRLSDDLALLKSYFTEWDSEEDEKAFKHLQNI